MEFKEYRLEEVAKIYDSLHQTPNYVKTGLPMVRVTDISEGYLNISGALKITEEDYALFTKKYVPSYNDIIMSRVGTYGICSIVKTNNKFCLGQNTLIISPNQNKEYLYYYLISKQCKSQIENIVSGSTQKTISLENIKNLIIYLPSLNDQIKVAKILSDIDKKIEINKKENDNLQKLSRELYKYWFINFEFPNEYGKPYRSSGGKMIESELGKIPEGWAVGCVSDGILTSIIKPGINIYDNEKKYVATADVDDVIIKNFQNISYCDRPSRANMQPIKNSVWFAKMQSSKKNILVDKNCKNIIENYIFSTGFMGLECKKNSIYYIWNYINAESFSILKESMSTGTLMAGLSNSVMNNFKYTIPSQRLLDEFNEILSSYYSTIFNNNNMNTNLQSLKNILLSKLMNGEIDLENINI